MSIDPADALFAARRTATPIESLSPHLAEDDIAGGYALQARLIAQSLDADRIFAGWKIGLTSPAALALFGADQPMVGRIFADSIIPDGGSLDMARTCAPRIEGEILLEIGHLPPADADDAALIASIALVRPAMEIADSRIAGWPRRAAHAIADNACCGWIVPSARGVAATGIDFAALAMEMTEDGASIITGKGSDCMGSILNVYRWFVARAHECGWPVLPGEIVLTGAMGAPAPLDGCHDYRLSISGFDPVTLSTGVAR